MKRLLGYKGKCQHLGWDGKRCRKLAKIREAYYGDETQHNTTCVEVDVCEDHALQMFSRADLVDLPLVIYQEESSITFHLPKTERQRTR